MDSAVVERTPIGDRAVAKELELEVGGGAGRGGGRSRGTAWAWTGEGLPGGGSVTCRTSMP
ncbi:hypothetical protein [Cellulomonas soli]